MLQTFNLLPDILFWRNRDTLYKVGIKDGTKFTLYRLIAICDGGKNEYPLYQSIDKKDIDRRIEEEQKTWKNFTYRIEKNSYLITEIK